MSWEAWGTPPDRDLREEADATADAPAPRSEDMRVVVEAELAAAVPPIYLDMSPVAMFERMQSVLSVRRKAFSNFRVVQP